MHRRVKHMGSLGVMMSVFAVLLISCSGGATPKSTVPGLGVQKLSAGSVAVTVTPRQLDSRGARFDIALVTHSGDLGVDLARSTTLEVAGRRWPTARWSGDGPGGITGAGALHSRRAVRRRARFASSSVAYPPRSLSFGSVDTHGFRSAVLARRDHAHDPVTTRGSW